MQRENYEKYGIKWYDIVTEPNACPICIEAAKKGPFKLSDIKKGDNAPVFHPWCRCAISPNTKGMRDEMEKSIKEFKQLKNKLSATKK